MQRCEARNMRHSRFRHHEPSLVLIPSPVPGLRGLRPFYIRHLDNTKRGDGPPTSINLLNSSVFKLKQKQPSQAKIEGGAKRVAHIVRVPRLPAVVLCGGTALDVSGLHRVSDKTELHRWGRNAGRELLKGTAKRQKAQTGRNGHSERQRYFATQKRTPPQDSWP